MKILHARRLIGLSVFAKNVRVMLQKLSLSIRNLVPMHMVTLGRFNKRLDVWTVEREGGQSVFRQLSLADMRSWLDDYSLGELWEKNVIGARP